ncbi:hypothetical protein PENTCL1PPCAC_14277, partial [Pristionchus entomophagus]
IVFPVEEHTIMAFVQIEDGTSHVRGAFLHLKRGCRSAEVRLHPAGMDRRAANAVGLPVDCHILREHVLGGLAHRIGDEVSRCRPASQ